MASSRHRVCAFIAVLFLLVNLFGAAAFSGNKTNSFYYKDYSYILRTYVNNDGMVNYKKLKTDKALLDKFIISIGALDEKIYNTWNRNEKLAFWINTYNALTLDIVLKNYPIQASLYLGLRFPKNSIRQISGVWDEIEFKVMNKSMTLNHIEHNIIRKEFDEPRIHLALVCASKGCPPLSNVPYTGGKLGVQLSGQARKFLKIPQNFRIDDSSKTVFVSSIFQWYGDDFTKSHGVSANNTWYSTSEISVLNFISKNINAEIISRKYKLKYLDYDWSLNEQ